MLRVHSEDADIVERVHDINVIYIGGTNRIVDQFQQRGVLQLFRFVIDIADSYFQQITTKQSALSVSLRGSDLV